MDTILTLVELCIASLSILSSYFLLGLPLARLVRVKKFEQNLFAVIIGLCVSIPLTLLYYFIVSPEFRKLVHYSVLSGIAFCMVVNAIHRVGFNKPKFWSNLYLPIGSLLSSLTLDHFTTHRLQNFAGIYAGNGDLPYYSALAKLIRTASRDSEGWITGVDMRLDFFGNWGYGGGGGAASLAYSSLIMDRNILESILPTFICYFVVLMCGTYLILSVFDFSMKINLLISGIAVVNVNVLYLASQGFTQMFISMIGVELLMIAGYWELKNPAKDWLQAVPMLLISAIGSYTQYLCYPILGAPFLIFYIVVFIFFISINFKKKLYGYKIGVLFGLAGCFIPLIVWPSRLIEVFSQIPMFTSGVPGWPYMVAKPTALFFGSPMGTSWNIADILLFALFIIYVAKRLKDSDLHLKVAILGYLVVGILLTTIFGIRDGFNAYTTWKASYFVTPLAITIALMIFAKRYNTKKIENMFRMEILLSATLLLSFMSSYQAVINRSVPLTKFPISELTSALNLGQMNSTNTVALGPLDQLWATYSSNRQISPIAQNIHVSQKFSKLKKGDILVTYLDDLEAVKFCPNLDLSEFIELKSGVWYKTFEAKTEVKISC